jgi:hypothetical protein
MMTSYLKVRPSNLREYMRVAIFNTLTSFTNNVIVCLFRVFRFINKVERF